MRQLTRNYGWLFLSLACLIFSCRKDAIIQNDRQPSTNIQRAKTFFQDSVASLAGQPQNKRATFQKQPVWNLSQEITFKGRPAVWVPVKYTGDPLINSTLTKQTRYHLSDFTHLLIYQDPTGKSHAELVTYLPDTSALKSGFKGHSGLLLVEDWSGATLHRYQRMASGKSLVFSPSHPSNPSQLIITIDYYIDGYNYAADDPGGGESWSEYVGSSTYYIPDESSSPDYGGNYTDALVTGSAGGGGTGSPTNQSNSTTVVVTTGPAPLTNIPRYLGCFTNDPNASYTLTVCVDQPKPGQRDAWAITTGGIDGSAQTGNPIDVGHTFLILTQNSGSTKTVRNIGFYPSGRVDPIFPTSTGQFNNNEAHSYDVQATFPLNSNSFFNLISYIQNVWSQNVSYDLNNFNCTSFALAALHASGIQFQSTVGSWPGGMGNNPGDLGEDLRAIPYPIAIVNTNYAEHDNQGFCQ